MTRIKPLSLLLAAILAASTTALRWTWNDLRNSELQLHGRAGKELIYESSKYCRDPTMCRLKGFYYDLRTLHCYKIQSLAEETYVEFEDFDPADPEDTTCYNLGGGNVIGEHGYHFKRDPYLDMDMENQIIPPHTNKPIANADSGDMEIYQTANSLFGYRELKFRANGLYLLRLMFALVEEDDRQKSRTFSIHISGYEEEFMLKNKLNIFQAAGFYKAHDFFTTIRFRNQSHLIFEGKRIDTWANAAQLHFEPHSYYKDLMNGYCLTRFHSCNKFCHDPENCKAKGCIYDLKNSHCIENFDEEEICKSYSHNKTMCTQHGCNYCCETSMCSMEANSNCMDTDCGRYCMEENMCLQNKPESCSYNSDERTCVEHTPTPKLQVAFVINAGVDPEIEKEKNTTKTFKDTSVIMAKEIKKIYGDPEFAVTTFADWDGTVWQGNHNDPEGCYQLLQEMTTDIAKIEQVNVKELLSIGRSNGPTALAWTCADTRVGWTIGKFLETKKGPKRPLVRILILFDLRGFYERIATFTGTDDDYEGAWGNRMESLLSGINKCLLNKQPYLESVYTALTLHDVSVIGAFDIENGIYYEENFGHKYLTTFKTDKDDVSDILDKFNAHVAERANPRREFEKEKLCQSISNDKTSCLLRGCSFCCETSTCTAEPSSDCMDTGCSRHCLEKEKCLRNKIPNDCFYNSSEESCFDLENLACPATPKLQIAIVVDAAYSDQRGEYIGSRYVFEEALKHIDRLKAKYEDPEFAVTSFADWDNSVWFGTKPDGTFKSPLRKQKKQKVRPNAPTPPINDRNEISHNDGEGCYKLVQKMTMDIQVIKETQAKIKYRIRARENNGPTALSWTSSDPRLKWKDTKSFEAENGGKRPLVKLLILIDHIGFDAERANPNDNNINWQPTGSKGNRGESVDGLNTCQTNMRPELNEVYKVLTKHDIIVFGLFSRSGYSYYKNNFTYPLFEAFDNQSPYSTIDNFFKQLHEFIYKKAYKGVDLDPACLN